MAEKPPPPRDIAKDPYASFRFRVELESLEVSGFSEVTGLAAETDVESFREGGLNDHERQLAGPSKFPSKLILKRGLADADALWEWYRKVLAGRIERKNVTIKLLDHAGEERWRWVFKEAFPTKWSGPDFRAGTAEVAFESVELAHRGFDPGGNSGKQ